MNKLIDETDIDSAYRLIESFGCHASIYFSGKGSFCQEDDCIHIDLTEISRSKSQFWSMVFHELTHLHCFQNNILKKYHHGQNYIEKGKYVKYLKSHGFSAEQKVDKIAKRFFKMYFPNLRYLKAWRKCDETEYLQWVSELKND